MTGRERRLEDLIRNIEKYGTLPAKYYYLAILEFVRELIEEVDDLKVKLKDVECKIK